MNVIDDIEPTFEERVATVEDPDLQAGVQRIQVAISQLLHAREAQTHDNEAVWDAELILDYEMRFILALYKDVVQWYQAVDEQATALLVELYEKAVDLLDETVCPDWYMRQPVDMKADSCRRLSELRNYSAMIA